MNKKIKIYIAGPMRGYPQLNFAAFDEAKEQIYKKFGRDKVLVVSPADIDRLFEGWGEIPPEKIDLTEQEEKEILRRDIEFIMTLTKKDAIYALKGWEDSKGANVEIALARNFGIPVLFQRS